MSTLHNTTRRPSPVPRADTTITDPPTPGRHRAQPGTDPLFRAAFIVRNRSDLADVRTPRRLTSSQQLVARIRGGAA